MLAAACEDPGVRYGIVSGGGLRRLLFYRIDSFNEEVGLHAIALAFGLGIECSSWSSS